MIKISILMLGEGQECTVRYPPGVKYIVSTENKTVEYEHWKKSSSTWASILSIRQQQPIPRATWNLGCTNSDHSNNKTQIHINSWVNQLNTHTTGLMEEVLFYSQGPAFKKKIMRHMKSKSKTNKQQICQKTTQSQNQTQRWSIYWNYPTETLNYEGKYKIPW